MSPPFRHHRHLPEGPRSGQARAQENHRPPGEEDSDEILSALLHSLHPEILIKIEKTISGHEGFLFSIFLCNILLYLLQELAKTGIVREDEVARIGSEENIGK